MSKRTAGGNSQAKKLVKVSAQGNHTHRSWQPLQSETEESKVKSLSLAILLHALTAACLYFGIAHSEVQVELAGTPIEVTLADIPTARKIAVQPQLVPAVRPSTPTRPKPAANLDDVTDQKITPPVIKPPDPNSIEPPEPEPDPKPTPEDIARAEALDNLIQEKEENERRREEAIRKQQALDEERERQAAIEAEDNNAALQGNSADNSKLAQYASLLNSHIESRSQIRQGLRAGFRCQARIQQLPGGEVMSVTRLEVCNATQNEFDELIESVMLASPLPYDGYEDVFNANIDVEFKK